MEGFGIHKTWITFAIFLLVMNTNGIECQAHDDEGKDK